MELSEFLLARIAEDEAVTQQATLSAKWWDWPGREGHKEATVRAHEDPYVALNVTNGNAAHIARHDPARVLAECAAKRRIVEQQRRTHEMANQLNGVIHHGSAHGLKWAMKALALPYADHPEYREEWRP